ncbi:AdoMet_MTases domain containing protein [Burkholderiales bacterium]
MSVSVDLGCGNEPKNPFGADHVIGLDLVADQSKGIRQCDLTGGVLPFQDNGIDFVTAFDCIEHIPRVLHNGHLLKFPFVELMAEIHRILLPGGKFLSFTPAFPCKEAFSDPTHVNIITDETFPLYFCAGGARRYGFNGKFELEIQRWHDWSEWPLTVKNLTNITPPTSHLVTVLVRV